MMLSPLPSMRIGRVVDAAPEPAEKTILFRDDAASHP
jgi:hypothetical protein